MMWGPVNGRAKVDLFSDHIAEAIPWIERSIAIADETLGRDHPKAAISRFDLVLARWEQGRRDEAIALARDIALRMRAAGPDGAPIAAHVQRWLDEHIPRE
jgi:hypothetical protein